MQTITLQLCQREFIVQPFTVGQVEDISEILTRDAPKKTMNREIIAVALAEDYPDITLESVRKMRLGTTRAIASAVREILLFGEFIEEKPSGEAQGAPASPA